MINLTFLRTFLTVAKCRTITEAAEVMGVDQPSVSRQMKILQADLCVELMKTTPFGTALTQAVERLALKGPEIFEGIEFIKTELRQMNGTVAGTLRIIGENFGPL